MKLWRNNIGCFLVDMGKVFLLQMLQVFHIISLEMLINYHRFFYNIHAVPYDCCV